MSPQDRNQAEHADENEQARNRHGDRSHRIVGKGGLRQPVEDSSVLNDCRDQAQYADHNEACAENYGAVRKIEVRVQAPRLEIGVQFADAETKPDQGQRCSNPGHKSALRGFAIALSGKFRRDIAAGCGLVHGRRKLLLARLRPQLKLDGNLLGSVF